MKYILFIIILLIVVIAVFFYKNLKTPENLGVSNGELAPLPSSPNAVSSQTNMEDKKVAPFPFKKTLEETKIAIKKALQAYGGIDIVKEQSNYIHAVSTTPLLHFNDDLEFYFDENARCVQFRSASRTGYSDMGLNKKRYEHLMDLYTTQN